MTYTGLAPFTHPFIPGSVSNPGILGLVPSPPSGATGSKFLRDDATWAIPTDMGVTTIGTFDGNTPSADGLSILGTELFAQSADITFPGMMNTIAQSFSGEKTFKNNTILTTACVGVSTAYISASLTVGGGNSEIQPCATFYNSIPADSSAQVLFYPNSNSANDSFVIQPLRYNHDSNGTLSFCPTTGKVSFGALAGTSLVNAGTSNQFQITTVGFFGYSSSGSIPTYNLHIVDANTDNYLCFINNTKPTTNAGGLQIESVGAANTLDLINAGTGYGLNVNCTSTGRAFQIQNSGVQSLFINGAGNINTTGFIITSNSFFSNSGTSVGGTQHDVYQTGGVGRWSWNLIAAETGSGNTGSDLILFSLADNGSFLGNALKIIRSSSLAQFFGNVSAATIGKTFSIATGSGGMSGDTAAMTAGSVTVSNTNITNNHRVFPFHLTLGGTIGILSVVVTAGVGFVINSTSSLDTSTITYVIFLQT